MYAAFVKQLCTTLLCLNLSVVLVVSPIWAGSFRTQGQGNPHCTIILKFITIVQISNLPINEVREDPRLFHDADGSTKGVVTLEILQDAKTRPARRTQEDAGTSCWAPWGSSWRTSPPSRTFRGARADNLVLDVKISRTSQAQRCEIAREA